MPLSSGAPQFQARIGWPYESVPIWRRSVGGARLLLVAATAPALGGLAAVGAATIIDAKVSARAITAATRNRLSRFMGISFCRRSTVAEQAGTGVAAVPAPGRTDAHPETPPHAAWPDSRVPRSRSAATSGCPAGRRRLPGTGRGAAHTTDKPLHNTVVLDSAAPHQVQGGRHDGQ